MRISLVYNIHIFFLCHAERGTVFSEGKKCNMAPAVITNCIKAMVEIVSRHSDLKVTSNLINYRLIYVMKYTSEIEIIKCVAFMCNIT
jgi:hypothetical protein